MNCKRYTSLFFLTSFMLLLMTAQAQDLTPWTSNPYGNEWIEDYTKPYVRVGVTADGVYKVSLANLNARVDGTPFTKENVQIWHRGKEVAVISANDTEVVFYGQKNDGASDGLMFRPGPEARLDKTTSFYSFEGSYFFTTADSPKRSTSVNGQPAAGTTKESYSVQTLIRNNGEKLDVNGKSRFANMYMGFAFSQETNTDLLNSSFFNAPNAFIQDVASPLNFFRYGNVIDAIPPTEFKEKFILKGYVAQPSEPIIFEYAVHGNGEYKLVDALDSHNYITSISPDEAGLYSSETTIETNGIYNFGHRKLEGFVLNPTNHISDDGEGYFGIKSSKTEDRFKDMFGFSYYSIRYPRKLDMEGLVSHEFSFYNSVTETRQVELTNVASEAWVFDISDPYNPAHITNTSYAGNVLTMDITRTGEPLKLWVGLQTVAVQTIEASKVYEVSFNALVSRTSQEDSILVNGGINPLAYDYLMITHTDLPARNVLEGAREYANYRGSGVGGSRRTLLVSIRQLYDQFNYGEPSPLAIRRFVDYMISAGVRGNHYLFIIGHAVSFPRAIEIELPGQVPTYGNPASDGLLVSELRHSPQSDPDIPAIPVGRLTAFSTQEVRNYLNKVKQYESQTTAQSASQLEWRKKVLQIVGAHNGQVGTFKGAFNQAQSNMLNEGVYPWRIETIANEDALGNYDNTKKMAPVDEKIADGGVGMIAYFGHGNRGTMAYNMEDPSKDRYQPSTFNGKYPFVYITGCGVGDVYYQSQQELAGKWLVLENEGAIVLMANSYKAYIATVSSYMSKLYAGIFGVGDAGRKSIGKIWVDVAKETLGGGTAGRISAADNIVTANIHQTNIHGDPSINILNIQSTTLPVELQSFEGKLVGENAVYLEWETAWEKDNDSFEIERSSDGRTFINIGSVKILETETLGSKYSFLDIEPLKGINYYRLKQLDKLGQSGKREHTYSNMISVMVPTSKYVTIYPNPGNDKVYIETNKEILGMKSWKLLNMNGMVLKTGEAAFVTIHEFSAGMYILEITTEEGLVVRQNLLKQ